MKKIMLIAVILLSIGFTQHVFAQGFVPLASIPGLTDIQPTQGGLADFFNNLYKYLIGLAAILAIIEIIWGGLEISTKDSVSKQSDGKERITQAIFGLVLVLSPVLVFSIINPSILNLSLNLPKLDTKSGGSNQNIPTPDNTPAPATGCTTSQSGLFIEKAVCASGKDAQGYYNDTGTCKNTQLKPVIPIECHGPREAGTGICLDTSFAVVCSGKTLDLLAYQAYEFLGLQKRHNGPELTVPRDVQEENIFTSGCTSEGGKVVKKFQPSLFDSFSSCPLDVNIPTTVTGETYGYDCEPVRLTCTSQ